MTTNSHSQELQTALARLIEGEAEPDDDVLVAEKLRTDPELRIELCQQLHIDALLRLEAEPATAGFVEAVAARIRPPTEDARDFIQRVTIAVSASSRVSTHERSFPGSWISRRSLVATTAGIVFGVLCTSMLSAYVGPSPGKVLTLLDDSFESGPAPEVTGLPKESGRWSGDFTEIVEEQQGVKPASGTRMLRFLRADYEGKVKPDGSYVSDVYQLVDVRAYRSEFGDGGAVAQLSAAFNTFAFPAVEGFNRSVALYALDTKMASDLWKQDGGTLDRKSLSMVRNSHNAVDRDPKTWQPLIAELRLPMHTDFLLLHVSVAHASVSQRRVTFDGHYLDDVRLTLARRAPLP